ncbi:MAG: ABC transporter permease [Oscillospiraceae bacterium]|jgi:NitT/TauT family transport system permease protein|nr:ABC transporter permease [Oscillospiraceae bacterium]
MENKIEFSQEHILFLKKQKRKSIFIWISKFGIFIIFLSIWEISVNFKWTDGFLISSPGRICKTLLMLYSNNQLFNNVAYTAIETVSGFILGTFLGMIFAIFIWLSDFLSKILDPYLVILNAIPKVAFGPVIIAWAGAGVKSIILMSLLMSVVISIINMLSSFKETDKEKIFLMKTFGANKLQILQKLILPSNIPNIISTLKINAGMSLVGVISGEFLVSNKGIGYFIIYGSQVFKLDLVMTGIFILSILAFLMYFIISKIEKYKTKT